MMDTYMSLKSICIVTNKIVIRFKAFYTFILIPRRAYRFVTPIMHIQSCPGRAYPPPRQQCAKTIEIKIATE
jgi:hypothetical protein